MDNVHSFKKFSSTTTFSNFSASDCKRNFNVKKIDNLICFYTNADQYMNKRSEMEAYVEIFKPDIIGITEVKPKNGRFSVQESEVSLENYEMFHNFIYTKL